MNDFELLGLLYASGSLKWGRNYKIEIQTYRPELAEVFYERLSRIGMAQIKKNGTNSVSLTGKANIENFLKRSGIIPPINKEKIPVQILDTGEKRRSFLRGFFEGKSAIYPKKNLIRVSGNKTPLDEIKKLLALENVDSGVYSTGKYFSLYIEGKARCENFRKIGFLTNEKNDLLKQIVLFEKASAKNFETEDMEDALDRG
jgi:hypothetical protein